MAKERSTITVSPIARTGTDIKATASITESFFPAIIAGGVFSAFVADFASGRGPHVQGKFAGEVPNDELFCLNIDPNSAVGVSCLGASGFPSISASAGISSLAG